MGCFNNRPVPENDDHFGHFHLSGLSVRIGPIFQEPAEMLPLQQAFLDYPREIFLFSENIMPLIPWHMLFYLYLFALTFYLPFWIANSLIEDSEVWNQAWEEILKLCYSGWTFTSRQK